MFFSDFIGVDAYGNKYYLSFFKDYWGKRKRICIFNGFVEASKIPQEWHSWMHGSSDEVPVQNKPKKYPWIKGHLPILTGTLFSYKQKTSRDYVKNADVTDTKEYVPNLPSVKHYKSWNPQND